MQKLTECSAWSSICKSHSPLCPALGDPSGYHSPCLNSVHPQTSLKKKTYYIKFTSCIWITEFFCWLAIFVTLGDVIAQTKIIGETSISVKLSPLAISIIMVPSNPWKNWYHFLIIGTFRKIYRLSKNILAHPIKFSILIKNLVRFEFWEMAKSHYTSI